MNVSRPPTGLKPSSPLNQPSWKTRVSAPSEAPNDSRFISRALTGITTEPVIRKSRISVPTATRPSAHGPRLSSSSWKSTTEAAPPVT